MNHKLIGLFLVTIGIAMFIMALIYKKTEKLQYAWMGFGIVYMLGIFGVLTNKSMLNYFGIVTTKSFMSPLPFIILGVGIMLSYIFIRNNERMLILSILFVVGLHFLPFGNVAYLLAGLVFVNCIIGFFFKNTDVTMYIFSDALIKIVFGGVLFYLN